MRRWTRPVPSSANPGYGPSARASTRSGSATNICCPWPSWSTGGSNRSWRRCCRSWATGCWRPPMPHSRSWSSPMPRGGCCGGRAARRSGGWPTASASTRAPTGARAWSAPMRSAPRWWPGGRCWCIPPSTSSAPTTSGRAPRRRCTIRATAGCWAPSTSAARRPPSTPRRCRWSPPSPGWRRASCASGITRPWNGCVPARRRCWRGSAGGRWRSMRTAGPPGSPG